MKKLKYILSSVLVLGSLASCDSETIDEKLKEENLESKSILRFVLNDKVTVVSEDINIDWGTSNSMILTAKMSVKNDEATTADTKYKKATLIIHLSQLAMANYPTIWDMESPSNFISSASLIMNELDEDGKPYDETYSTTNGPEGVRAGYANITSIVEKARTLAGDFEYTLYPPEGSIMMTQQISDGQMHYIKY